MGTSLGFCVRDILKGNIRLNQVIGMETHTAISNEEQLIKVLEQYCMYQWTLDNDWDTWKAINATYILYYNKPFFQPRLTAGYSIADPEKKMWMFAHRSSAPKPVFKKKYKHKTLEKKVRKASKHIIALMHSKGHFFKTCHCCKEKVQ